MIPSRIVAVDPGLASGIAVLSYDNNDLAVKYSAELDLMELGEMFRGLIADEENLGAEIVIERFVITTATAKNSQAPWSLKGIGMLEWLLWDIWGMPAEKVIYQSPAEAKRLVPNPILRRSCLS